MTNDHELEAWRQEWRKQTQPLPEAVLNIKDRIRRQNLRMFWGYVICYGALLLFTALGALHHPTSYWVLFAELFWPGMLILTGYRFWTLRGTWRPVAQTTRAYLELNYNRAAAVARYSRFFIYFLIVATVVYAPFVTWIWIHRCGNIRPLMLWLMLVAELPFFLWLHWRKVKKLRDAKRLLDEIGA